MRFPSVRRCVSMAWKVGHRSRLNQRAYPAGSVPTTYRSLPQPTTGYHRLPQATTAYREPTVTGWADGLRQRWILDFSWVFDLRKRGADDCFWAVGFGAARG